MAFRRRTDGLPAACKPRFRLSGSQNTPSFEPPLRLDSISDQTTNTDQDSDSGRRLTRRRLLLGAGGTVGLAGGGAAYVISELDGEFDGSTAPDSYPALSTRGQFDAGDSGSLSPQREGTWAIEEADELYLFVHGFDTSDSVAKNQGYTTQLGLEPLRPGPVVTYSWDSVGEWGVAKSAADANAAPLADWLVRWAAEDGRPIHLIGYSLGARVSCETLRMLADGGHTDAVASLSLLGGAIPHDSVEEGTRYGEAIAELDISVNNFHSRSDRVLGWVYRLSDRTPAVGHDGIRDAEARPAGYQDVDVTDLVSDHYSYFEPDDGCLPRVADQLESS